MTGAWNKGYTGAGVVIGIHDDGVDYNNTDLFPNYRAAQSFDFVDNDTNAFPGFSDSDHGTSVAGVAAARGGNGIGGTGAAPNAGFAALRTDYNHTATVNALGFQTANIHIRNHSYRLTGSNYATSASLTNVANALRASNLGGTINVFSAGNTRGGTNADSNKSAVRNGTDNISIAALNSTGRFASYSSYGANVTVTAPSGDGSVNIVTTDRVGSAGYNTNGVGDFADLSYTNSFDGTSSAAPLVSGCVALMREARVSNGGLSNADGLDDLAWQRYTKHLLARSAAVVDASDTSVTSNVVQSGNYTNGGGWVTNGSGQRFNQNYGFGLIDAGSLVTHAEQIIGVSDLLTESTGTISVGATVTDNNIVGVTRFFNLSGTSPLEEMLITLNATHAFQGDLEAVLVSPQGTASRLMRADAGTSGNLNWTFTSNAFWGEQAVGQWKLIVRDQTAQDTGVWNSFAATARMGDIVTATNRFTWDGGGADNNGKTYGNWAGDVSPNNSGVGTIIFAGSNKPSVDLGEVTTGANTYNRVAWNVKGVEFAGGAAAFTLNNNGTIAVGSGGISSAAATDQAVNLPVKLSDDATFATTGTGDLRVGGTVNTNGNTLTTSAGANSLLEIAGVISGSGDLTVAGVGETRLSGVNTYTGGTTVNSGVLNIASSSATGTGDVSVIGGVITGDGGIAGSLANPTGTVSVGNSVGLLTVGGNFSQSAGGTMLFEIASAVSFDRLIVGGGASLGGTLQIAFLGGFLPTENLTFDFLTAGSLSGAFHSIVSLDSAYTFTLTTQNGVGTLRANAAVVAVPEVGTGWLVVMVTGGGALVGVVRRRKTGA